MKRYGFYWVVTQWLFVVFNNEFFRNNAIDLTIKNHDFTVINGLTVKILIGL